MAVNLYVSQEKFEYTKGVVRSNSKDRQYNDQNKKTSNCAQTTTHIAMCIIWF